MTRELIDLYWTEGAQVRQLLVGEPYTSQILQLTDKVWETYQRKGTIYLCANGGGAGLVSNAIADFGYHPFVSDDKTKPLDVDKLPFRRLKVMDLSAHPSVITGVSNDLGYENVFFGQLQGSLENNDMVFGFSGSGNSANVLKAFEYANSQGAYTACVSGRGGGKANNVAQLNIVIPGKSEFPGFVGSNDNNQHIEGAFVDIGHIVTGLLRMRVAEMYRGGQ
jgi:D-sedoheptulose 7-phosphate isomerase